MQPFILTTSGTKLTETEFQETTLDRYCLHIIEKKELRLSDVILELQSNLPEQPSNTDIAKAMAKWLYKDAPDPDTAFKRFVNREYQSDHIMRKILSDVEYRYWRMFKRQF